MHLRLNALVFAVLTVLIAILGAWSGDSQLGKLWLLPLALLLLGLAYEAWVVSRAQLSLRITSAEQGILGRPMSLQLQLHQELGRGDGPRGNRRLRLVKRAALPVRTPPPSRRRRSPPWRTPPPRR